MSTPATTLKFTRTVDGLRAVGTDHIFFITRTRESTLPWAVEVCTKVDIDGEAFAYGVVTREKVNSQALAKAVARAYDADSLATEKPYLNRMTRAIEHGYDNA